MDSSWWWCTRKSCSGLLTVHHPIFSSRFWDQCDGAILSTLESYESEAIARITEWQKELSREVYTFGPLFPTWAEAAAGEQKQSDKAEEISRFLETTLETDGPNSLLYVRHLSNLHEMRHHDLIPAYRSPSVPSSGQQARRRFGHSSTQLWRKRYHS